MIGMGTGEPSARRFVGGLSLRQFLGITCLFWVYVALSNILYAYSMRIGIARLTTGSVFAAWDARLLQHVMLLPLLLVSFWASLRIQWRPLLVALPLQLVLGVVFAALAYPAIELTLLDDQNNVAVRRVLWPQDYVPPGTPIAAGLPAHSTQIMIVRLDTGNAVASNFRVQIFYP